MGEKGVRGGEGRGVKALVLRNNVGFVCMKFRKMEIIKNTLN